MSSLVTSEHTQRRSFIPDVQSDDEDCSCCMACAIGVYYIVELFKYALKHFCIGGWDSLKKHTNVAFHEGTKIVSSLEESFAEIAFFIADISHAIFQNIESYLTSGWSTGMKVAVIIPPTISEFMELAGQVGMSTAKEISFYSASGCDQVAKLGVEAPNRGHEMILSAKELTEELIQSISTMVCSGGFEALKVFQDGAQGTREVCQTIWMIILEDTVSEFIGQAKSGWDEFINLIGGLPEVIEETTLGIREVLSAIIANLLRYIVSGIHQLDCLSDAIPIIGEILCLAKDSIMEVITILIGYGISGYQESKKIPPEALKAFDEATMSARELIHDMVTTLLQYAYSGIQEMGKIVDEAPNAVQEGIIPFQITAEGIYASLIEYAQTGGLEGIKCLTKTSTTFAELGYSALELIQIVITEIIAYLQDGGIEGLASLMAAGELIEQGFIAPREVVVTIASNVQDMFQSSANEGKKGVVNGIPSVLEMGQIPYEFIEAVCINLFEYDSSGAIQANLLFLILREDMPNVLYIVKTDFGNYFRPKWCRFKQKYAQRRAEINASFQRRWASFQARIGAA